MITKVKIQNYRRFKEFELELNDGLNILVGNNDTGKSTVIEAINLALTGRLNGRGLHEGLSPYLFNQDATKEFVEALQAGDPATPPKMIIEVYLGDGAEEAEVLRGSNNLDGEDACGVRLQATFNPDYQEEYDSFVEEPDKVRLVPTEYYRIDWLGFSGSAVTRRSLPAAVAVIDPASIRLQSGVDYHLQHIIRTQLEPKERVELSREYRSLREEFDDKESVKTINERLREDNGELTDRELSLSIDISQRYTWESSLVAHLDSLPFQYIGKGDQNAVKTLLAIGRHAEDKQIVMIEEPETHLSFAKLRALLPRIAAQCEGKQVIIATHSAYVLNKLGLDGAILLGPTGAATRVTDLSVETVSFFKRLPGHDTLRLVLADGAILVEGSSDELVVQRAYRDKNGREPLDDGVDVISVGTSHKRFMELAAGLRRRTWAVRDNDGKNAEEMQAKFDGYLVEGLITLHHGANPEDERTLEPAIVNSNDLQVLNTALGEEYATKEDAVKGMTGSKTESALRIYESATTIEMPGYIRDVC
ncbi:MAG: AAA family ATPase [Acidimicrobiales bacterium]|nr:AAA family ATPase [Acidimicrobiales bacterium]